MKQKTRSIALPAVYATNLDRMIGVLQQIQALMGADGNVTLVDVAHLVMAVQQEFGEQESLENVIQALVSRQCAVQVAQRKSPVSVRQEEMA